jgi:hypothetical protein
LKCTIPVLERKPSLRIDHQGIGIHCLDLWNIRVTDFIVLATIKWLGAQENMKVIITEHAKRRLNNLRQDKITIEDIINAAPEIPAHVPSAARFRGFFARSGRMFDLVVKDIPAGRLVITIIGKRSPKK